jgi:asparagine synthase (glutamine-hydrolysing)
LAGGQERGLARKAFSADVPPSILNREWKDRAPRFFEAVVSRNIDFAREMLLDGFLVQNKILNRAALEDLLSGAPTKRPGHIAEVVDHLSVELWLRTWASTTSHRVLANVC